MTGMHSMTFSPWSLSTSLSTPWVEGCCGPRLRMSSSVSRPSSLSMTGSGMFAASTVVRLSTALEDLFAQAEDTFGQRFGAGRTAWDVDVDRNDRVDTLERRVAVPELATRARAVAHRDHPLGLGHLLVQPAEPGSHLVGHGA